MVPAEDGPQDDQPDAWLADYDEALATDSATLPPSLRPTPPELAALLEPLEAVLRRLDRDRRAADPSGGTLSPIFLPEGAIAFESTGSPPALGRFRIERELGRGGYGVVFLAWDPLLTRHVALKVPRPEVVLSPELNRRFLREAQLAAGLNHPNLVPVYETSELGPIAYIASRYCEGPNLAAWLRQQVGPVPVRLAARLVADVAEGVHHAHERGILHRDLKPGNVLLEPRPGTAADAMAFTPQVTDFGLAKLVQAPNGDTRSGALLGTPQYMAPEQAEERLGEVGAPTDVFALGAILYEVLTGRPPFQGASVLETLRLVVKAEPAPPRKLRRDLPRDLEAICLKCLEKSPGRRYVTAAELAADLRRFVAGRPTVARPLGWAGRAGKWVRRRPLAATGLGLLVAVLGAFGLGAWQFLHNLHEQEETRSAVDRYRDLAEARDLLNRRLSYATELADFAKRWKGQQYSDDPRQRLERLRPEPGEPDLRGFEWFYFSGRVPRAPRILAANHDGWAETWFSANADWCASVGRDGVVNLWDVSSGRLRTALRLQPEAEPVWNVVVSGDGTRLMCWAGGPGGGSMYTSPPPDNDPVKFTLWEVPGGKLLARQVARRRNYNAVAVASGGRRVAYLSDTNAGWEVRLWDTATGEDRGLHAQAPRNAHYLGFSPDGKRLAIACGGFGENPQLHVEIWDVEHPKAGTKLPGPPGLAVTLTFSPDGRTLAVGNWHSGPPQVWLCDTWTGKRLATLEGFSGQAVALGFSPDGKILAAGEADSPGKVPQVSLWDVATGTRLARSFPAVSGVTRVAFSPDGRTLAIGGMDGRVRLWDMTSMPEFEVLARPGQREAWSVAFSPDGQTLAAGYDDAQGGDQETLQLWDLRSGRVRTTLTGHGSMVYQVALTPDGQTVVSAGHDKTVRLWDLQTGRLRHLLHGHTDKVRCVACAPDGRRLASGGRDRTVRLWDVTTGCPQFTLTGHADWAFQVAFAPDGKTLASASLDGSVRIWDVETGEPIRILTDPGKFLALAYSPDGKTLATGNEVGLIKLWDPAGGKERAQLEGHRGPVHVLAYSPDGKTLASGGKDRSVGLWQAATGRPLLAFEDLPEQVHGLAFSADGRSLAAALHDGSIRLWRADREGQ